MPNIANPILDVNNLLHLSQGHIMQQVLENALSKEQIKNLTIIVK